MTDTTLFNTTDPIGASADLVDNGKPILFQLPNGQKAFVIRWQGALHGYTNECQHASVPMDFDGDILESGRRLCCINQREAKLPQTPGAAMPRPPFGACPVQ